MARDQQDSGFDPLGWMFTFSDLVTLLLTFFVMLLAMKAPEVRKFKDIFGIFQSGSSASLNPSNKAEIKDIYQLTKTIRPPSMEEITSEAQRLAEKLNAPVAPEAVLEGALQGGVKLKSTPRGLVITLANDLIFAPGSADLSPRARKAIAQAAPLLRYNRFQISVEGNTDNVPPKPGGMYVDNWALSLARAEAVLRVLVDQEKIDPKRLRVAALADTRPLVPNDTPEHRAMNRRTEIVLLMNQK